jgi:hypothetical protein
MGTLSARSYGLFQDEIESLVSNSPTPLKWFVLDTEAMTDMDVSGLEAFREVMRLLSLSISGNPTVRIPKCKIIGFTCQF